MILRNPLSRILFYTCTSSVGQWVNRPNFPHRDPSTKIRRSKNFVSNIALSWRMKIDRGTTITIIHESSTIAFDVVVHLFVSFRSFFSWRTRKSLATVRPLFQRRRRTVTAGGCGTLGSREDEDTQGVELAVAFRRRTASSSSSFSPPPPPFSAIPRSPPHFLNFFSSARNDTAELGPDYMAVRRKERLFLLSPPFQRIP